MPESIHEDHGDQLIKADYGGKSGELSVDELQQSRDQLMARKRELESQLNVSARLIWLGAIAFSTNFDRIIVGYWARCRLYALNGHTGCPALDYPACNAPASHSISFPSQAVRARISRTKGQNNQIKRLVGCLNVCKDDFTQLHAPPNGKQEEAMLAVGSRLLNSLCPPDVIASHSEGHNLAGTRASQCVDDAAGRERCNTSEVRWT